MGGGLGQRSAADGRKQRLACWGRLKKERKEEERKEKRERNAGVFLRIWQLKGSLSGAFSGSHTDCSCFPCYCCDCVINNMCLVLPMNFIQEWSDSFLPLPWMPEPYLWVLFQPGFPTCARTFWLQGKMRLMCLDTLFFCVGSLLLILCFFSYGRTYPLCPTPLTSHISHSGHYPFHAFPTRLLLTFPCTWSPMRTCQPCSFKYPLSSPFTFSFHLNNTPISIYTIPTRIYVP